MTSFPVYKQSLITRKRCEIEQKLQLTTNSKLGSAFQNPQIKLSGENVITSFPVYKQSLITRKRREIEQKLQLTTNSKLGSASESPVKIEVRRHLGEKTL